MSQLSIFLVGENLNLPECPSWPTDLSDREDIINVMTVAATSPEQARDLAASNSSDEGAAVWRNETETFCQLIGTAAPSIKEPMVLMMAKQK